MNGKSVKIPQTKYELERLVRNGYTVEYTACGTPYSTRFSPELQRFYSKAQDGSEFISEELHVSPELVTRLYKPDEAANADVKIDEVPVAKLEWDTKWRTVTTTIVTQEYQNLVA